MAAKPPTGFIRTPELPEPRDVVEGALYFVGPGSSEAPLQMFIGDAPYKLKPIGSTGIKSGYTHRQNTLSQVWTVNHNLGYRPAVSVFRDDVIQVEAMVEHVSDNQCRITLLLPCRGLARLA